MKTKTLTLEHYDQTFELKMSDGSKHEITINDDNYIGIDFDSDPRIWEDTPENLLKSWIRIGSVVNNLNLSHVVSFTSDSTSNEREEQVIYTKHWLWGWKKDNSTDDLE